MITNIIYSFVEKANLFHATSFDQEQFSGSEILPVAFWFLHALNMKIMVSKLRIPGVNKLNPVTGK